MWFINYPANMKCNDILMTKIKRSYCSKLGTPNYVVKLCIVKLSKCAQILLNMLTYESLFKLEKINKMQIVVLYVKNCEPKNCTTC